MVAISLSALRNEKQTAILHQRKDLRPIQTVTEFKIWVSGKDKVPLENLQWIYFCN